MFNTFCYLQRIISRLPLSVTGEHTSVFSMVANRMQAVVWLGWSARGESTARMIQVSKFVYIAHIYGLHYAILARGTILRALIKNNVFKYKTYTTKQ